MKRLALFLILAGAPAGTAPPPPASYPAGLPKEVDGYRMEIIYPIYHSWLNRQRKDALIAAVSSPEEWQGLSLWNRVVESEIVSYDFGVVRADRLDRYCAGDWIRQQKPGRCLYRYRYAVVPGSPWNDPLVNKAIADSFRPVQLARRLAALKFKESGNDWSNPTLQSAFEAHVDPTKLFAPLVRMNVVDASSCPNLAEAIGQLGKVNVDLSPEAVASPVDVMAPHGSRTEVRLTAADGEGRALVLSGASPLHGHLASIWGAVEGCAPVAGPIAAPAKPNKKGSEPTARSLRSSGRVPSR